MAIKLKSGFDNHRNALTAADVIAMKGRNLHSGFMDEFDHEAQRQARAISQARDLTPRKVGQRKAGFGRPAYHPNRSDVSPCLL